LVDNETGGEEVVSEGVAIGYAVPGGGIPDGKSLVGVGRCPDPSSPDGYGPEIVSPPVTEPFTTLSSPGRIFTFDIYDERGESVQCSTGTVIGEAFSGFGTSAASASFDFVAYSGIRNGTASWDCVCDGGPFAPVNQYITVRSASGTTQNVSIGTYTPSGSCSLFGIPVSRTRTVTTVLTGVLNSSSVPVS
jgi:hypothetical protein